jgi:glycosyltransferase involved in cell wall biosynthesis
LAEAINALLDNPARRAQLGAAGKLRVEREFSLETMTRKTLEVYAEVLRGGL